VTRLTQLNPPLYLTTPLGEGICHMVWHASPDEFFFGVFQDKTGECWWWPNHKIRLCTNLSEGRYRQSKITESKDMTAALAMHRERYNLIREDGHAPDRT